MFNEQVIFNALPAAFLILDKNFNIVMATDFWLKMTMTKREDAIGHQVFELFPEAPDKSNTDGRGDFRSSLDYVIQYGKPHTMAVLKYSIPKPNKPGVFEDRYWCPVNTPIFDETGDVAFIINQTEEVTDFMLPQNFTDEQNRIHKELLGKNSRMEGEIYRSTQLLLSREREIHNILEHAPIGMATIDLNGSFLEVNKSLCNLLGYTKYQLLKLRNEDVTYPDDLQLEDNYLTDLLNDQIKSYQMEKRYVRKDGSQLCTQITVSAVRNHSDAPTHLIAQIEDITQRKLIEERLAKSHKQNEALLSSLPVGILVHAPDGSITFCNPEAAFIIGVSPKQLLGTISTDKLGLMREDGSIMPIDEYPINQILKNQKSIKEMVIGIKHTDQIVWASVNAFPEFNANNQLTQIVMTLTNISEKKEAAKNLDLKAKALNRSNDALDEFAYIASHDLKEPLRGICNYSSFLLEDYGDKLDAEGKSQLQTLQKLSFRMESLLDNLLKFSRVSRIDLAFTPCNLNDIVIDKVQLLETFASDNHATIEIMQDLPTMICNQSRIGQVFQNLITNGIKYNSSETKHIWINYEDRPDSCIFSVRDNGIGIAPKYHDTVFKIFRRLHGRDEYGGGTGAGLTLAKKIVERHGGDMWIESDEGKGSTFFFSINKNITIQETDEL